MPERVYEGWNIGAVSVKRVRLQVDGTVQANIHRHGGQPERVVGEMLQAGGDRVPDGVVVTGPQAPILFTLPYLPESICIEAALRYLQLEPDLVLSLGGETFVVYCLVAGVVRKMVSSNRCAAGSGEFLVQQFGRMNLDLEAGIQAAKEGHRVKMASRCSVHCKSDATHKLNKGECTPADIAISLIADLAAKIANLVKSANWPTGRILLSGGLIRNEILASELRGLISESQVDLLPESAYLEAFGAAVAASEAGPQSVVPQKAWRREASAAHFEVRPPLDQSTARVRRMAGKGFAAARPGMELILGVDAGSTTTKAVLFDPNGRQAVAGCYLRTHGNPVRATLECLEELKRQLAEAGFSLAGTFRIVQVAATGSGRDLVSVYLNNCLSFNEILAHARAAREVVPEADTLFEIGGQDAKFVALQSGIPVDYSMNDGCSAGTGSFLEEAAASDMQVSIEEIGPLALSGSHPVAFGERCAAFINSEVRSALQQGAPRADVLGGLVHAITDNYVSRVVGARHIGHTILLQGGVALNPALAPAVAERTGMNVLVPPNPELMGCVGAAQMAGDLLDTGMVSAWDRDLNSFDKVEMKVEGTFACKACENRCEIQKIVLNNQVYPFGGLCSKWEMQRRPKALRYAEGKDLVSLRHLLMFETFAPRPTAKPRGRIGLPLALSTYELYPFYAKLLVELGYEVILSGRGHGDRRTYAPICYPGEIMHGAVSDLITQGVDYIFLPYLREFHIAEGHTHGYLCPVVEDIPGVIKTFFEAHASKILTPEIGLSEHLLVTSELEVVRMAERLGIPKQQARKALEAALDYQKEFNKTYQEAIQSELEVLDGPAVILVGRPYAAFAPEVNLSIPRKIASRGLTVIPGDGLPFRPPANERNVWHFTQGALSAVDYSRRHEDRYVCALSCFSCGPDAITHHRLRHELEGAPFCFLEIDSHTAHAGIETRIGAFLDIIEERRRQPRPARPSLISRAAPAHLERKNGKFNVVDSVGRELRLDDARVRHILLADLPWITSQITVSLYGTLGWRAIATPFMSYETLQKARRVCSGRECLPFLAMIGKVVAHLETRPAGEMTVFHLLEQEGPCQIGNWYDAFAMVLRQLGEDDAVAVWPTINNNYLGSGERGALILAAAALAGDLMGEVRSSLCCLAVNPEAALATLDEFEHHLLAAARHGVIATERELLRIARRLAEIPLHSRPEDIPKVLLFGGINRIFVDKPIRKFFEDRGILAKTNDVSEFISLLEFEWVVRPGFAHGHIRPEEYYSVSTILGDLIRGPARNVSLRTLRARMHCQVVEWLEKHWRRIMGRSGLLFATHIPFRELAREGQDKVSWNGYTEAPCTVGRYLSCLHESVFDGYVNIGAFNCTPANTATAVISAMGTRSDVPYAVIEADGATLTASQVRQLETVAAQCLGRQREKTEKRTRFGHPLFLCG